MRDFRNLPEAVLERLTETFGKEALSDPIVGFDVVVRNDRVESRTNKIEVRATEDGAPIISGYATIYDTWYDVFGGPPIGWREMFAEGACKKSVAERDDVRLLFNHDGLPLARTKSGTLSLADESVGLYYTTPDGVDLRAPSAQDLVVALEREDVDESSLAFRTLKQEWNDDFTERIIREVKLFDVSPVTYPANPYTVAQVRAEEAGHVPPTPQRMSVTLAQAIVDSTRL